MKKINAVIVDDEKHSVEKLAWKLEQFCPEVNVQATFTDALEALEHLRQNTPDLLFLDIEMPRLNGFEILDEMGNSNFEVIFITAYSEFGIQAVKVSALDYLLKPVQNKELKAAIEKYKSKYSIGTPASASTEKTPAKKSVKIPLATKESIEFVSPEDIILCSSDSNYTMIHLINGRKKLISKTLKEVETWLSDHGFYRAHNSHLVNLAHIKEYVRADGGYLVLTEGKNLPVARNRKDDLLKLI